MLPAGKAPSNDHAGHAHDDGGVEGLTWPGVRPHATMVGMLSFKRAALVRLLAVAGCVSVLVAMALVASAPWERERDSSLKGRHALSVTRAKKNARNRPLTGSLVGGNRGRTRRTRR